MLTLGGVKTNLSIRMMVTLYIIIGQQVSNSY